MKKNYQRWHELKRQVQNAVIVRPHVHEREVWYCHLGENVGYEQDGKGASFMRPVLVFRKFNNEIFWAIPLTSARKQGRYYSELAFGDRFSTAILSQLRLIDGKRLSHKIGVVAVAQFAEIAKNSRS